VYGTARDVAYKLTPNPNSSSWSYSVLYRFCQWTNCADGEYTDSALTMDPKGNQNCADGAYPNPSLIMDAAGRLYGTTMDGGALGRGTAFSIDTKINW